MNSLILSSIAAVSPLVSSLPEQPRIVYFDFGGVVATVDPERNVKYLVDVLGFSREAIQDSPHVRWIQLHPDEVEYLQEKAHFALSAEDLENYRLAKRAAMIPVPGVEELVFELRQNGYVVHLISNVRPENIDLLEPFKPLFDQVILTPGDVGAREIWEREAKLRGVACFGLLLIDDQFPNVEEARKYGVQTIAFENGEALRKALVIQYRFLYKADDRLFVDSARTGGEIKPVGPVRRNPPGADVRRRSQFA